MNYLQKGIFATLWDYKQAGIIDPNIANDIFLNSYFFQLSSIQKSKIETGQEKINYHVHKEIENNLQLSSERTNQNDLNQELTLEVNNLVNSCNDLSSLENCLINFKKFHSLQGSSKLLMGAGNSSSKTLFISEMPSYEEELQQQPYIGESKELFEKIIISMGLRPLSDTNCDIFVIPSLPFRLVKTFGNKISDLELIKPFLKKYIEIISPKYLIFISKMPATILGLTEFLKFENKDGYLGKYLGIPTIEIESIKSMINNSEYKRKTWNNLKLIMQLMKSENE